MEGDSITVQCVRGSYKLRLLDRLLVRGKLSLPGVQYSWGNAFCSCMAC